MFAYCGNNPVVRKDCTGMAFGKSITATFINDSGDEVWYRPIDTSPPSDFAKEMDTLISDATNANSIQDFIDIYNRINQYETVQNITAVDQIAFRWDSIKEGLAYYSLPMPTFWDEFVGMGKTIWGFAEIIQGVVELID